jgi:hypothetical protein
LLSSHQRHRRRRSGTFASVENLTTATTHRPPIHIHTNTHTNSRDDEHKRLASLSEHGLEQLSGPLHTQWQRERGLAALEANEAFAASRTHQRRLLQQATRQLLAALHKALAHEAPEALDGALQSLSSSPSSGPSSAALSLLLEKLGELKAVLAQRFRSTLQQDLHASTVLATMTERHRLAEAAVGSLSAAVDASRLGTAKEAAALEELRARLEGELGEWETRTAGAMQAIEAEVDRAVAEATAAHHARKAELDAGIVALLPEMNRRAEAHAAEAAALRAQQAQAEAELAGLLEAYEREAGEKRVALETLRVAAGGEAQELGELREHFEIVALQQEERRQMEEARRAAAEAKRAEEAAAAQRMLRSVVQIQAMYRGFKAWKAYRSAKTAGAAGAAEGGKKKKGAKGGAAAAKKGKGKEKEKESGGGEKKAGTGSKAPVAVKAPAKASAAKKK